MQLAAAAEHVFGDLRGRCLRTRDLSVQLVAGVGFTAVFVGDAGAGQTVCAGVDRAVGGTVKVHVLHANVLQRVGQLDGDHAAAIVEGVHADRRDLRVRQVQLRDHDKTGAALACDVGQAVRERHAGEVVAAGDVGLGGIAEEAHRLFADADNGEGVVLTASGMGDGFGNFQRAGVVLADVFQLRRAARITVGHGQHAVFHVFRRGEVGEGSTAVLLAQFHVAGAADVCRQHSAPRRFIRSARIGGDDKRYGAALERVGRAETAAVSLRRRGGRAEEGHGFQALAALKGARAELADACGDLKALQRGAAVEHGAGDLREVCGEGDAPELRVAAHVERLRRAAVGKRGIGIFKDDLLHIFAVCDIAHAAERAGFDGLDAHRHGDLCDLGDRSTVLHAGYAAVRGVERVRGNAHDVIGLAVHDVLRGQGHLAAAAGVALDPCRAVAQLKGEGVYRLGGLLRLLAAAGGGVRRVGKIIIDR